MVVGFRFSLRGGWCEHLTSANKQQTGTPEITFISFDGNTWISWPFLLDLHLQTKVLSLELLYKVVTVLHF